MSTSSSSVEPPPPGTEDDPVGGFLLPVEPVPRTSKMSSEGAMVEHEEGEIQDDDEDQLQYENISSDEEFTTIRERIAELQAMDTELGLLNQITGRTSGGEHRPYAFDKRMPPVISDKNKENNYECISDDEDLELYLRRYEPVPKPKPLPVRRKSRTLRPSGTRLGLRSVVTAVGSGSSSKSRHGRTGLKRRTQSATLEKRKHDNSARKQSSLHRKHKRRKTHTAPMMVSISDSDSESDADFPLDRARLQAACSINTRKRKTDKENWDALKRKLHLQMLQKRQKDHATELLNDCTKEVQIVSDEPMVLVDDDDEEDEEVLQLRLQALQTKAELKETGIISLLDETLVPSDKAPEEQELRMLALQSAFTKKHQIRLKKRQEERPYSPSDEIELLSPVNELIPAFCTPPINEVVNVDDDVQIIVTRPETVEIADSSDEENRMEISPSASPAEYPEPPNVQPVDMELASSGDSRSPAPIVNAKEQPPAKEQTLELDSPLSQADEDLQSKFPQEDDEETLRNQLLSNLSASVPVPRPMTPDSMGEEEAEALRELILSRMNSKRTSNKSQNQTQAVPVCVPCHSSEAPSADSLPTNTPAIVAPQPRVQTNPNLITLIGKQKITRRKRKKSLSSKVLNTAKALAAKQATECGAPVAIAAARPARRLVKTPVARIPTPSTVPLVIQPPIITTKLLVNPNKLININRINPLNSPKERSAIVENYVQKPVAKLVIQLGQSESDSDPDYYPEPDDPEPEPDINRLREAFLRDLDNASPSRVTLESPTYSPVPETEGDSIPEAPAALNKQGDAAFEQRLDQFLKTVRNKIDQNQCNEQTVTAQKKLPTVSSTGSGFSGSGTGNKQVRKNITAPPTPITPSAVRHLPKSAQAEYKQLLVRMAQLEKQKQQRIIIQKRTCPEKPPAPILTKTIINNGLTDSDSNKNHEIVVTVNHDRRDVVDKSCPVPVTVAPAPAPTPIVPAPLRRDTGTLVKRVLINNTVIAGSRSSPPPPVVPNSSVQIETKDNPISAVKAAMSVPKTQDSLNKVPNAAGRKDKSADRELTSLKEALKRLTTIKENDRSRVLTIAEKRYEQHSKQFRQELQNLIGKVENAQLERQRQYELENKVAFLREKLMVLERALSLHKNRITTLFPTLQESHTRVMASRKRSIELNNLCQSIGREVMGESYIPPSHLRNEIHQQLKVLTHETKVLKNMKRIPLNEFKAQTAEQRRRQLIGAKTALLVENGDQQDQDTEQRPIPSDPHRTNPVAPRETENAAAVDEETTPKQTTQNLSVVDMIIQHARSAPTSRSTSPLVALESTDKQALTQEAPAILSTNEATRMRFEKYTSPLASLQQNQSALNIPDGVICPYQMRGECIDKDCKFEHLQ